MKTKDKCELTQRDGNVILMVNGEEVFSKPKTKQTIALANALYFGYRYEPRRKKHEANKEK